jgi:hypothetical protein
VGGGENEKERGGENGTIKRKKRKKHLGKIL